MENGPGIVCEKCRHRMCVAKVPIFSGLTEEELGKISSLIYSSLLNLLTTDTFLAI